MLQFLPNASIMPLDNLAVQRGHTTGVPIPLIQKCCSCSHATSITWDRSAFATAASSCRNFVLSLQPTFLIIILLPSFFPHNLALETTEVLDYFIHLIISNWYPHAGNLSVLKTIFCGLPWMENSLQQLYDYCRTVEWLTRAFSFSTWFEKRRD